MSSRLMLWGSVAAIAATGACKPRIDSQSSVKANSPSSGLALDLLSVCRDSGSKRFMNGAGNVLNYDKKPGPKSQNGWEDWNQGVATLDQEQAETPFWRLSVPFNAEDDVPFCLIGRSALAPRELAAALGCIQDDPCKGAEEVADVLVFNGNGDLAPLRAAGLALADGAGPRCDGAQLLNGQGVKLGEVIPERLGGAAACQRIVKDFSLPDVACGFNGKGFTPFGVGAGLATGGGEQPERLQLCADLLRTARGKRVCALDGRGYRIYDLAERGEAGTAASTTDGTFNSLDECSAFLGDAAARGPSKGANLLGSALDSMDLDHASIHDMYNARFYPGAATGDTAYRYCTDADDFVFFSKCKVDTVYSWGPMVKISDLERQIGAGSWNQSRPIKRFDTNKPSPIFTTHSPVASHGYGEAAIRIRLKPGVEYVRGGMSDGCDKLSDPSRQVVERYADRSDWNFVELIICAPGPIHSWSYFSKQQFDEIANATNLIYPSLEAISSDLKGVRGNPQYFKVSGIFGFVGKGIDDGIITNFREHMFKARLAMMARSARAGLKRVYLNSDIRVTTKPKEHFTSRVLFPHQLTGVEEAQEGGAAAPNPAAQPAAFAVGVPCETVAGKTFSGGGRKVVLSGDCSEYTKAGTYYGAARNVATQMQWTIDSTVRPSRIQVEILEGPIKGDVFYYAVTGTQKICFAGQTNYTGATSSCMTY